MPGDPLAAVRNAGRLAALQATGLLGSPADAAFDRLARLAATVFRAPVALVSLVDAERQVFKGCLGLPEPWNSWRETPLSHSYCQHVVADRAPLAIEDARVHPLVLNSPAVADLGAIAYLGVPLITAQGDVLGSFCVIDRVPRSWSDADVQILSGLASSVMTEIDLRAALHQARRAAELVYYRALIENALDVILVLNPDGTIRYASPSGERVLGYVSDELTGQVGFDLIHPDDADRVRVAFRRVQATPGTVASARFRVRHRDGSWRVLDGIGQNLLHEPSILGIVFNFRDITELHEARASLRVTETRLEHVLSGIPALLYALTLEGETVVPTWISAGITQILGYEPDETLSTPDWWRERIHPDDRARVLASQSQLQSHGRLTYEYRFRHKDGSYRWIRDRLRVLSERSGRPRHIVGLWVDVTEQKRAEEAIRQSEKLAALGRLAAGLAHELRNPLTVIAGHVDLLRAQTAGGKTITTDRLGHHMARLEEAAARMRRIMEGLSLYSKPPKPEPQALDVRQLLEATQELIAYEARKNAIAVSVEVPPGPPPIRADRSQFMQVLVNIVTNAVEAMAQQGGTLALRARLASPESVVVEIADTGPGIPQEALAKIWEPFYTTKAEGTGLGLSIVHSLVTQQLGGTIDVDSEVGRGTTFRITLPAGI